MGLRRLKNPRVLIGIAIALITMATLLVHIAQLPKQYERYARAKKCKNTPKIMRIALGNMYCGQAEDWLKENGGPPVDDLITPGVIFVDAVPDNPLDTDEMPNNVIDATGYERGAIVGLAGGWCYNPTNGEVWANSKTNGVYENRF